MSSVDNRVVEMQFENKQFESGVATTISSVKKLKEGLNFKDSAESLKNLGSVSKNVDMSNLIGAVESIKDRFSTLGIIGMTVLQNIANKAISVGSTLTKSLTLQPITDGFSEYETQMNAIQTILSNTRSEGTNIQQVNAALDELNHYADQTIYNFTEMTRNIGTFTAAGVDLNTSVNAIQGIANLAAVSGSNSQQASTAMYQLSQALATGTVKLMDWNSVVNAGMGGQVFQDALKETSKELGTGAEAAIKANGSFRESLQTGWLTSKVLTETLKKFTTSGAMEWVANYCDVSKDAVQSAYDQAYANSKATDTIGKQKDAIDGCAEALAKQTGKSKDAIKETLSLAYDAQDAATKVKTFSQLIDTLKEALGSGWTKSWQIMIGDFEEAREMWTNVSVVLSDMINRSADARNALLQDWANLGGRKAIIDGIATAFNNIVSVAGAVSKAFREVFPPVTAQQLMNISNGFKTLMENMKPTEESLSKISRIAKGFFSGLDLIKKGLMSVLGPIGNFVGSNGLGGLATSLLDVLASVGDFVTSLDEAADKGKFFETISSTLATGLNGLKTVLDNIGGGFDNFTGKIDTIVGKFKDFISSAIEPLKNVLTCLKENISLNDIFSGLIAGSIVKAFSNIAGVFQKIQDAIDDFTGDGGEKVKGIKESITDLLGTLGDTLQTFQTQVKATSLLEIAAAVTLLVSSLDTLSDLDAGQAISGVAVIGVLMKELNMSLRSISGMDSKGVIKSAAAMILVAKAVNTLSKAIASVGSLSFSQIIKGLGGVSASLFGLSKAAQAIGKTKVSLKSSIAVLALAEACKILSNAVEKIGSMNFKSMVKGVGGIGVVLTELVGATVILDKFTGGKGAVTGAAAVLILAQALSKIGPALESVGNLSWDQIGKGLTGIGLALAEMIAVVAVLSNTTGIDGGITSAAAILILALALKPIGDELTALSGLSWDQIKTGLAAMGGALVELVIALSVAGLSGLSGLIGAISIDVVAFGLQSIADALLTFGSMSWDQVKTGLVSMGGALAELVIATGTEGLMGVSAALGAISIDTIVSQLDSLANALIKFGSMSWDDVSRGLTSMIGALSETALGGLLNTFSGFGAGAISEMAEPLGTLADSVKKWSDVTVPDGLADQLGQLADGVGKFWASGWGAGAISEVAEPLGTLASSVSKWSSVSVPENIGTSLSSLATGVNSFTFSGLAGGGIASVAEPLGNLAKSVNKWNDVKVPENIQGMLQSLATGVNAFTFSGFAGGGISEIVEPLKSLAGAVTAWSGVTIPEGIGTGLSSLAAGINSFSTANASAGTLSTAAGGLKTLAGAVTTLGSTDLIGVAAKVKEFASALRDAPTSLSGTAEGIGTSLQTVANAITSNSALISNAFTTVLNSATTAITNSSGSFTTAANTITQGFATALTNGLSSQQGAATTAVTSIMVAMQNQATSSGAASSTNFENAGKAMTTALKRGINNGKSSCVTAVRNVVNSCKSAVDSSGFYTVGLNLAQGMANGIHAGAYKAINAAANMGAKAVQAAKAATGEHSPSKLTHQIGLFFDQGLINGIIALKKKVGMTAASVGDIAVAKMQDSMSGATATLTPVIDSNNVLASMSNKRFKVDTRFVGSITSPMSNMQSAIEQSNLETMKSNAQVLNAINELNDNLGSYADAVANSETAMYVDGKKLASSIAKPMNQQLGVLSRRGGLA